jgi:hypothetical protein
MQVTSTRMATAAVALCFGTLLAVWCSRGVQAQQPGSTSSAQFQVYRNSIEPIFLKKREGGLICYNCHSVLPTRLRLQPLSSASSTWTEEQSRQNFEVVSQLISPGEPMKSRLLLHPLAQDAGGDSMHTGGKFWKSQDDPEWQMIADWVRSASPMEAAAGSSTALTLDFEFFKTRVEPIFLKKRPEHVRCYVCHEGGRRNFKLAPLEPAQTFWTDEQSHQNFQNVLQLVIPGDPSTSTFLNHPLAPEAGGESFHDGGRQFESKNDPDWMTMEKWVRGAKADDSSKQPARQ